MDGGALDNSIQYLPGVGPKRAALLKSELGVGTFGELIRLYPFRYIDRSTFIRIADAVPDMAYIQIRAKVVSRTLYTASGPLDTDDAAKAGKGKSAVRRMSVLIEDGSGVMETVFFKGIKWMYDKLIPGQEFIFFGKPSSFNGRMNMVHPEVDPVPAAGQAMSVGAGKMTGIYTSTERLKNSGITEKVMNRIMASALDASLIYVRESLPDYILKEKNLVPIHYALRNIHFPSDQDALAKARYRLKFEELFYLQLSLLKQKYVRSRNECGIRMPKVGEYFNACYNSLPFPLTGAQKRVITEIRDDMKSGHQMNRLLQGDVGSGKTMVALLTALIAIGNGYQACIMAPTEVLAQQHFRNLSGYLEVTGEEMTKFYRPPQGKYSEANLKMAQELEYKTFFWSLAYVDWYDDNQPSREEAFEKLLGRIHPGAIVLLHSTSDTNALILDELIQKWEEMGYTIRSLTELL